MIATLVIHVNLHVPVSKDEKRLLRTFAQVESGNHNLPPYADGYEQAWGLYGFHRGRWKECAPDGAEWGKATPLQQDLAMLKALRRYSRHCWRRGIPVTLNTIGRCHNGGPVINKPNAYTRRLAAAWKRVGGSNQKKGR